MKNLVYKELKLAISPFFLILPLILALLMFIPSWIYTLVFMYFFWITAPQIFSGYIAKQDYSFSMMLPISKKEYVKAKIYSIYIIEGLHIAFGIIFAIIHNWIYGSFNWFFDLNIAFFGLIFVLYSVFNIVVLPLYFKTGYKWGIPVILGAVATLAFGFVMEFGVFKYSWFSHVMEGATGLQLIVLAVSIMISIVVNIMTTNKSVINYESSL